jgi:hypothetical protein
MCVFDYAQLRYDNGILSRGSGRAHLLIGTHGEDCAKYVSPNYNVDNHRVTVNFTVTIKVFLNSII